MIYLNIGRRKQGKTTLTTYMARRVERRIMFDPRGLMQFGTTVQSPGAFIDAYAELQDGERQEIVYTPSADLQKGFASFARHGRAWVRRFPGRPLALVVDEAAFVETDVEDFMWILRCSDPAIHHVFTTAHRPSDVNTKVRAIADHWLLFGVRQEHDLKVIAERCGPGVARDVRRLGPREFVHWDDAIGESRTFKDPASWYVPLGAPRPAPLPPTGLEDLPSSVDRSKLFG